MTDCYLIPLSPAGGIAYIGSARIAWELGVRFNLNKGFLQTEFYGASLLHSLILKAYNEFMRKMENVGLGELVSKGLIYYLGNAFSYIMSSKALTYLDLVYLTMFELTLLDDPALQLPVFNSEFTKAYISIIKPREVDRIVFIISPTVYGTLPLYGITKPITAFVKSYAENITIEFSKLKVLYQVLVGIYQKTSSIQCDIVRDKTSIVFYPNKTVSGLVLLKVRIPGRCIARCYLVSYGVMVKHNRVIFRGKVVIEGYRLNIVAYRGVFYVTGMSVPVDLVIGGRRVAKILFDPYGCS